jgi:hypothetical protein
MSNRPQVWGIYRLLLPGSYDPQTLSLSNPRFGIRPRREALGFLNEFTEPSDPHPESLLILEDLVRRITHGPILWTERQIEKQHIITLCASLSDIAIASPADLIGFASMRGRLTRVTCSTRTQITVVTDSYLLMAT